MIQDENYFNDKDSPMRVERKKRKLSLAAVSEMTGISASALARMEQGVVSPCHKDGRKLFEFYDQQIALGAVYDPIVYDQL